MDDESDWDGDVLGGKDGSCDWWSTMSTVTSALPLDFADALIDRDLAPVRLSY